MEFHDLRVLEFRYRTVQLNRLNWSQFVDKPNPVASALMARMKIRKRERPMVKLQCLRLLATLRLDKEKSGLISHFVSSYLRLNSQEMRVYEENLETIPVQERQVVVQYTNEWIEQGIERGIEQGIEQGSRIELLAAIELGLELRFGVSGLRLLPEVQKIRDIEMLRILRGALRTAPTLDDWHRLLVIPPQKDTAH